MFDFSGIEQKQDKAKTIQVTASNAATVQLAMVDPSYRKYRRQAQLCLSGAPVEGVTSVTFKGEEFTLRQSGSTISVVHNASSAEAFGQLYSLVVEAGVGIRHELDA